MSEAGQTSNAQAVAIRNVEEGFTWQGLLKPKSFFVDEVATEVHILGALAGNELVGTIVYDVMKTYEDRAEVELYILDAHVKPKWQRQGVFTGLFNAMTQCHQAAGSRATLPTPTLRGWPRNSTGPLFCEAAHHKRPGDFGAKLQAAAAVLGRKLPGTSGIFLVLRCLPGAIDQTAERGVKPDALYHYYYLKASALDACRINIARTSPALLHAGLTRMKDLLIL